MAGPHPTSEVDIVNLALDRLGQPPITSVDTPTTPPEDKVAKHYAATRRALLRSYIFNFAKKYAALTASGTVTPEFGFDAAYALPNDYIRLLVIGGTDVTDSVPPGLFDVVDGHIYTDESDDTDTLNIRYVYDNKTVTKWDALFVKLMVLELAAALAPGFTLKPSVRTDIENQLKDVRLQAAAVAGQEKPVQRIQRSKLVAMRRTGIGRRDTTRW